MCGIAFIARTDGNTLGQAGLKAASSLLMSNQLRGVDSAGICWLDGEDPQLYKTAESAASARMHTASSFSSITSPFLLMHTRAATIGGITDDTAHPFHHPESNLIGVHNGTISEYKELWPSVAKDALSDSMALYNELGDTSADDALDVISAIHSGAFAMIWYDARIQAVRFVRNSQRPLWLWQGSIGGSGEHLIISSRPEYIAQAVAHAHPSDPLAYMEVMPVEVRTNALVTIPLHLSDAESKTEPSIVTFEPAKKPATVLAPYTPAEKWDRKYDYYGNQTYDYTYSDSRYGSSAYTADWWNKHDDDDLSF